MRKIYKNGSLDNDRSLEDELLRDFKSGMNKCKRCNGMGEIIIEYLNEKGDDMEQRKEFCECMTKDEEFNKAFKDNT